MGAGRWRQVDRGAVELATRGLRVFAGRAEVEPQRDGAGTCVDELSGASLPFGWYRRNPEFRASVLNGGVTPGAQTDAERRRARAPVTWDEVLGERAGGTTKASHSAEPDTAPAAQAPAAPAALPY